ncbi:hypothetical protein [Azospirillum endophyticum]
MRMRTSSYSPANSTLSTRIIRPRVNSGRGCRSCNSERGRGRGDDGAKLPRWKGASRLPRDELVRRIGAFPRCASGTACLWYLCDRPQFARPGSDSQGERRFADPRTSIPSIRKVSRSPVTGPTKRLRRRLRHRLSGHPRRKEVAGWRVRIGGERTKPRSWLWPQGGSPARVDRAVLAALVSAVRRFRSVAPYASPTTDAASRRPDRSRGFPGSRR